MISDTLIQFIGPSHAIQVGRPIENIVALYEKAGSLIDVTDEILAKEEANVSDEVNMSKLF